MLEIARGSTSERPSPSRGNEARNEHARAGFAPGSGGRTVSTCLKTVRRDWPHLQWWRAIADNGQLDEEQRSHVAKAGFETEIVEGGSVAIKSFTAQLMNWEEREDV